MEEKRDFSKPGREGFPQRRGFYGQARGFNSKSYGNRTWTFYEDEQWENFQRWMKDEKERKRKEETKDLLKGVDEIMQKRLKREKGKKQRPQIVKVVKRKVRLKMRNQRRALGRNRTRRKGK